MKNILEKRREGLLQIKNEFICNRDFLQDALYMVLKDISLVGFSSFFINQLDGIMQYIDLCLNKKNVCQKLSLLFNPHRLDTKCKNNIHSCYSALQDKNYCNGLARAALFQKGSFMGSKNNFYDALQIGVQGVQFVFEFPPEKARFLTKKYCRDNGAVLDPCAGWGGRMIGVSSCNVSYVSFEPSVKTFQGLNKCRLFLNEFKKFNCEIYNMPYEDSIKKGIIVPNSFDFALTSPPYYDSEIYSDEETNSLNRYGNFNDWVEGFYLPLISNTMNALKDNCYFILNIGNRKYPLDQILLDNFAKDYIIEKDATLLAGTKYGIRTIGKGEFFYRIQKKGPGIKNVF